MLQITKYDTLTSLYRDELKAFNNNAYNTAKQEYEALNIYYKKLLDLRNSGVKHQNDIWQDTMKSMIQNTIEDVLHRIEELNPVIKKGAMTGDIFCDYETRKHKLEILENILREEFKVRPKIFGGQLEFVSLNVEHEAS